MDCTAAGTHRQRHGCCCADAEGLVHQQLPLKFAGSDPDLQKVTSAVAVSLHD
jgi:hypothetical protein